jgi:hypothetical protein
MVDRLGRMLAMFRYKRVSDADHVPKKDFPEPQHVGMTLSCLI